MQIGLVVIKWRSLISLSKEKTVGIGERLSHSMTILHTHDINDGGDEIRRAADKSQLFHLVEQVAPLLALDTPYFFKGRDRERTLTGTRIDTDASHHCDLSPMVIVWRMYR